MTSPIGEQRPARRPDGLALIEVMMSVVLLATVSIFVLQAFATIARAQSVSECRLIALDFASGKLEEIQRDAAVSETLEGGSGSFRVGQRRFQWEVGFEPIDWSERIQSANLSVQWRDGTELNVSRFRTFVGVQVEEEPENP